MSRERVGRRAFLGNAATAAGVLFWQGDRFTRAETPAMLDGLIWLPEVGKSTHYHAYYVHPSWVSEMKRMYKFGVHTFYRPRAWGDGSEAPSWGTPAQTAEISAKLAEAAKSSAEMSGTVVRR